MRREQGENVEKRRRKNDWKNVGERRRGETYRRRKKEGRWKEGEEGMLMTYSDSITRIGI